MCELKNNHLAYLKTKHIKKGVGGIISSEEV